MRSSARIVYLFGTFMLSIVSKTVEDSTNCSSTPGQNKWNIQARQTNVVPVNLIVGEWRRFDCTLSRNAINATLWQHKHGNKNKTQRIPDGHHVKILEKNVFLIMGLKMSDGGNYYCQACGLRKLVGRLYITAEENAFAKPNVTKVPNTQISAYGSTVTLVCDVSKSYLVQWYKVGVDEHLIADDVKDVNKANVRRKTFVIPSVSEKDDGIYVCVIKRFIVKYVANATIIIKSQEAKAPSFAVFNASSEVILKENDQIFVKYSVFGIPPPNVTWFRSKNGLHVEKIAVCPSTLNHCELSHRRKEKITKNAFNVLQVEYPTDDNVTFTCHATNHVGKTSKSFIMQVHSKPRFKTVKLRTHKYHKGMQLNCSIQKANPKIDNFTWQYCDPEISICDPKNDGMWKHIHLDYVTFKKANLTFSLVLDGQHQLRIHYRCKAKNILGTDQISFVIIKVEEPSDQVAKDSPLLFLSTAIPVGIFCLSFILVVSFVMCKRIKIYGGLYIFSYPPMRNYIDQLDYSKDIREQIRKLPYVPEWEFPREKVSLQSELGKGEFGSVWLAYANGITEFCPRDALKHKFNRRRLSVFIRTLRSRNNSYVDGKEVTAVAVKKLKDDSDKEKLIDLQSELKILIHIGEHENIVNLMGACTKGTSYNLWIILEYCPNGDLRSFLQHRRNHYDENESSLAIDQSVKLGPRNLIYFALQISKGMEFLISRKVIHRDLAARNVLLGRGYVAKVADFGLARDVYKYQKYVKKSCTLVPLKWMAIESIQHSIFTEKTDVWSFGVVLWEIFTLGQTPYPGVSNLDVLTFLVDGQRMASPARSPPKIDELMKQCWENNPDKRPSFTMMVKMFEEHYAHEGSFKSIQNNLQNYDVASGFDDVETPPCDDNDDSLQKQGYLQVIFVEDEKESKK